MKKITTIVLVLLLVFSMAACSEIRKDPENSKPGESQSSQTTNPTESNPLASEPTDAKNPYETVIEKYRTALTEKWGQDKLESESISPLCLFESGGDGLNNIGYALIDVSGDGTKELVIANLTGDSGKTVFDLYTVAKGEVKQVFVSEERNRYYLCPLTDDKDGFEIVNQGSNGAGSSEWYSSVLSDGKLTIMQAVKYDSVTDPDKPWFLGSIEGGKIIYTSTEESTARSIMQAAEQNYFLPELTPFNE